MPCQAIVFVFLHVLGRKGEGILRAFAESRRGELAGTLWWDKSYAKAPEVMDVLYIQQRRINVYARDRKRVL